MILIDSNVIIDVLGDEAWRDWSIDQISVLSADHDLTVNQIIFAEVAPRHPSLDVFNGWLRKFAIAFEPFGEDAAYHAGLAFERYRARRRHGEAYRGSVLADFFIGGHALVADATILTRDPRFYRTYFPTVPLIAPEKDEND